MIKRLIKNPPRLYLIWFLILIFLTFIIIPLASIGHSAGEQVPLVLMNDIIGIGLYGFLIISLITEVSELKISHL